MQMEDTVVGELLSKAHFEIVLADVTSSRREDGALSTAIQRASSASVELERRSAALEMSDRDATKLTCLMARLRSKVQYLEAVQFLETAV
jgi:hypothetical protein